MRPTKKRTDLFSFLFPLLALSIAGELAGCGPDEPAPQPQPSVASLEVVRAPVAIKPKGAKERQPTTELRLEPATAVSTGKTGRAIVKLDHGATVLMDESTEIRITEQGIHLAEGRIFVDTRGEVHLSTDQGELRAVKAGLDARTGPKTTRIYCASGEVTYSPKDRKKGTQPKRLTSGMTLLLQKGSAELMPEALWNDWTGGFAQVGPRRPEPPAGIGRMEGRRLGGYGKATSPLLTRNHEVEVAIRDDLAVTTVTQTYFNPHSYQVKGFYEVELPESAIINEFQAGEDLDSLRSAEVMSRYRNQAKAYSPNVLLEWAGGRHYRGVVGSIEGGKTYVVRLIYVQWLERHPGRRIYHYPMGGGQAPLLGEFSLEVDVEKADAREIQASLGAERRGSKIVLRKSDFRPPADFVLELLEKERRQPKARVYRSASPKRGEPDTLYIIAPPPLPDPPERLSVVVIADLSAGTSPTEAKLVKDTVDGVLRQLRPTDKVAVLAADLDVRPLGEKPYLDLASKKRKGRILSVLSKTSPSGATDLAAALEQGARLLPKGRGVLIYVGDGEPTSGPLLPGTIKDRLARRGIYPRIFAVGVGGRADIEFLSDVAGPEGSARRVENRTEAAGAVFRILSHASRPCIREVTVETDAALEQQFPSRPSTITAGQQIRVTARSQKGALPKKVTVRGLREGKRFEKTYSVETTDVVDKGDLRRRWALARIEELLQRGSGREAVADIGMRYDVLTPWTALVIGGHNGYKSQLPNPHPGVYKVEDLVESGGVPRSVRIAIEPAWLVSKSSSVSWQKIYRDALRRRSEPVRVCFERKAAGHPELSGRVDLKIHLRPDGSVKKVEQVYSSLQDPEVEACIKRAIEALNLPAIPPGGPTTFTHSFNFTSPESRHLSRTRCSDASRKYLSTRRVLWRERLARRRSVAGAMGVWRSAYRRCELRTWLDRKVLLDLMLRYVGRTAQQVRLYHEFHRKPSIQRYIRRRILRSIRTRQDVEAARKGLNLEGRVDWALLKKGLDKAGSTGEKIELVQKFQALCPESVRLRALLLRLYEKAKRYSEADDLVSELRTDPAADMAVRRQIGEHYLRRKEKKEARRAFSEIVESAPFDPWARRYLGHLYLAHGWCLDAHREYETLAQLLPHDQTVPLMVSQAAECSGRLDEALRLQAKVSESSEKGANRSGPAAAARVLTSLLLAELRQDARGKKDEKRLRMIRARSRRLGVQTWARKMLISVRWPDRHRPIQVKMKKPGDDRLLGLPIVSRHLGLSASRQKHRLPGKYHIEARLEPDDPERAQTVKAELVVLLDEATEKERLLTRKLVFKPGVSALTFTLEGSKLYGKAEQTLSSLEARLVREGLVDVQTLDPSIMVDLKYAREDNFMGKPVYGSFKEAYLRPEAAEKLAQASQILQTRHPKLRILVGDALRPRSVQRKMFALVKNTPMRPYVASPERGSIHNYGAAVDVTLYDTEAGSRLDMGTRMDHFGPLAQPALEQKYLRKGELTPLQVTNRRILRKAMKAAGWHVLRIEWWHFTAFPRKMVERIYRIID